MIFLLTRPISLFAGLINPQVGLFWKFSLRFLSDMKACCFAIHSILSAVSSSVAKSFASSLIMLLIFFFALLYVFVTVWCSNLSYCVLLSS